MRCFTRQLSRSWARAERTAASRLNWLESRTALLPSRRPAGPHAGDEFLPLAVVPLVVVAVGAAAAAFEPGAVGAVPGGGAGDGFFARVAGAPSRPPPH